MVVWVLGNVLFVNGWVFILIICWWVLVNLSLSVGWNGCCILSLCLILVCFMMDSFVLFWIWVRLIYNLYLWKVSLMFFRMGLWRCCCRCVCGSWWWESDRFCLWENGGMNNLVFGKIFRNIWNFVGGGYIYK